VETTWGTSAFLFTDIEGSTELLRSEPDRYARILEEHAALVRRAVAEFGGTERKTVGDSFFCTFATARSAVLASYAAQQALRDHPFSHGASVPVRMGIHVGAAAERGGELVGLAINFGARIAASAHGGQVLVTDAVRALVTDELPEGMWLLDLGLHRFKDFPRPARVFQLCASDLVHQFPPLKSLGAGPLGNLPVQLTSFFGRDGELESVHRLLGPHKLVTLVGTGGSGKTRLAVELASRASSAFADGAWFVDLAAVDDGGGVDAAVAAAIGVREGGSGTVAPSGDWAPDRPVRQRVVDALCGKSALVILDNCEHVIEHSAALTTAVLQGCPDVRIIATSRQFLDVPGELAFRVPPLDGADAIDLFVDRATGVRPGGSFDASARGAIEDICRRVDGLPFAIELAAARVKVLSVMQIRDHLDDRLRFLRAGSGTTAGSRHHTLRAILDWSYELLALDEQRGLRRLSVFVGTFDLDAATAVIGSSRFDALDVLSALVEKSLLETEGESPTVRYRLLEGTRQYAYEKLIEAGDELDATAAHAIWFVALAEEIEPELAGASQATFLDRLERERGNLFAALEAGASTAAELVGAEVIRLASALTQFFLVRGFLSEGRQHLARALEACSAAPPSVTSLATARLSMLALFEGDSDDAERYAAEALRLSSGISETVVAQARAHNTLGQVAANRGRLDEAERHQRTALALSGGASDDWGVAYTHNYLGSVYMRAGRLGDARSQFEAALAVRRRLGDAWGLTWTCYRMGVLALFEGKVREARSRLQEGSALAYSIGFDQGRMLCLVSLGDAAVEEGDDDAAREHYEAALHGAEVLDDPTVVAIALAGLAAVSARAGEVEQGRAQLDDSRLATVTFPALQAARAHSAAVVARCSGDHVSAIEMQRTALRSRASVGDLRRVAEELEDLGSLVWEARQARDEAAYLAGAASAIRERIGAANPPARAAALTSLRTTLSSEAAWERGEAATIDAAIEVALAMSDATTTTS
jgi:predicted ATPase/class 3 adenylate cyclase